MIGPLRKVFRRTADGEERVQGLVDIKRGEVFRMEPANECPEDPFCPTKWMEAKTDGYLQEDGVQGIVIGRLIEVEGHVKTDTGGSALGAQEQRES